MIPAGRPIPPVVVSYLAAVHDFYEPLVARYDPDDVARTGWSSRETQRRRFERLVALSEMDGASDVVDIGCGTGELVAHLDGATQPRSYVGIDLMASNIDAAHRRFADRPWASFATGTPWDVLGPTDIVVASGLFSLPHPRWGEIVAETLEYLAHVARTVVVVNFLRLTPDLRSTPTTHRSSPVDLVDLLNRHSIAGVVVIDTSALDADLHVRVKGRAC